MNTKKLLGLYFIAISVVFIILSAIESGTGGAVFQGDPEPWRPVIYIVFLPIKILSYIMIMLVQPGVIYPELNWFYNFMINWVPPLIVLFIGIKLRSETKSKAHTH